MYIFNKITAIAVGALISLIDATKYESVTEVYDSGDNIIGYKNTKILMTGECLIRLYTIIPYDNNKNATGVCEITTTAKDGSETGSMKIHVEVDDHGYGFRSPIISVSDAIIDNINDNSEAIVNALKSVI